MRRTGSLDARKLLASVGAGAAPRRRDGVRSPAAVAVSGMSMSRHTLLCPFLLAKCLAEKPAPHDHRQNISFSVFREKGKIIGYLGKIFPFFFHATSYMPLRCVEKKWLRFAKKAL